MLNEVRREERMRSEKKIGLGERVLKERKRGGEMGCMHVPLQEGWLVD